LLAAEGHSHFGRTRRSESPLSSGSATSVATESDYECKIVTLI
jgi:hypothetical protein